MHHPKRHVFETNPHKTLLNLSFPVLVSLVAEPITGLVDTAFVAQLGAESLAALGVGATVLSGVFWIFNFLGIGTQTEVAHAWGGGRTERAKEANGIAFFLALAIGVILIGAGIAGAPAASDAMGAADNVLSDAVAYMEIRFLGSPAILVTIAAFGAMRGLQDMKTPLKIAVTLNVINIALDAVLIFGLGPVPAMGIDGAAWASVASQWLGALWAVACVRKAPGISRRIRLEDAAKLLRIGGDLFIRTGLLTGFLVLTTRAATLIGAEAGAAHQAIRQVWLFTALFLDAFAVSGQSLIGFFLGAGKPGLGRSVARAVCWWSLGTGFMLAFIMVAGTPVAEFLLVPATAHELFLVPWVVSAATQPVNAIAFATDGIHWGTGDFRFLRNVMLLSTAAGVAGLFFIDLETADALVWVWLVTGMWIALRAALGFVRIWPGIGKAPLAALRVAPGKRTDESSSF